MKAQVWRRFLLGLYLAAGFAGAHRDAFAQGIVNYYYDDLARLSKAVDRSGIQLTYAYDGNGNMTSITRGTAPGAGTLAILNFTPGSGPVGAQVTIQGQNFSSTLASNAVAFNGVPATVVAASSTSLTAIVPTTATTGPLSVTVGSATATSTSPYTIVASPAVLSVSPQFTVSSNVATTISSFTVSGANLTGATFSFAPAFTPPSIAINSVSVASGGTSATLNLTVGAGVKGSFTLLATNAAGSSSTIANTSNTLQVIDPDGDADGDGVTNAVEIALGTNPLNPQTSNAGLADGWQVFYALNPLSASSAGPDPGGSGSTALYDFQNNLSPRNPNRAAPGVVQISPANGASAVFINSVVVVRFGEPLQIGVSLAQAQASIGTALASNTTVSATSLAIAASTLQGYLNRTCCGNTVVPGVVTVSGPYGAITGSVTGSSDGLSITFAPSVPLTSNTTYTVKVNGVRDAAGNLMTVPYTSTFTTGATVDASIPTVKLVDPENNSTFVPTNAHYTVQFSKAMDPATLNQTTFTLYDQTVGANISGTVQVDASGLTASFIPTIPMPVGRGFTVTLTTALKDTVGNYLAAANTFYFTTGYTPETAPPHMMASSPVSGATGIPVNAIVDLEFNQPLNITTAAPNITVSQNGTPIQLQTALSSGDMRVTMTPVGGLQANVTYTVTIGGGITNIAGLGLDNAGSFSFQTAGVVDKNTLTVTSFAPANSATSVPLNAQMRIGFSKPVDVVTLTARNVELYPNNLGSSFPVATTIMPSADTLSVTLTPSALLANTSYCVYLSGVEDLEGNALSGSGSSCFTTGSGTQGTGPTVTAVSPQNSATGVAVNAVVEVSLSEPVSTASVGSNAIVVTAGGVNVPGTVSVPNSTTLLFTPANTLAISTAYSVAVGNFTDLAGNPATSFTSGFTTSSSTGSVTTGPTVVSITPVNASTNVPVTSAVTLTFSAAVNPITVNSNSVQVQANGYVVAGTYKVAGAVVTFTPLTALPGGATVRIYVGFYGSVQDPQGNNTSSASASFTTAATVDTTAPTVVLVTPSSGQTAVGLNGQVTVVFSKSMNPSTLTSNTIALLAGDVKQSFSVSISADNRTLVLSGLNLPASTVITLAIAGAADLSGNALASFTSQFTTAASPDTSHATIVSQRPASGATAVSTNASPVVLFANKPLNAASINGGTVQVTQNGQVVAGTLSVPGNGQTIEFTPSAPWPYGALVQVFVDPAALDTSGNSVNAYQGSFTVIGDPSVTAPKVVSYSPMSGATNVPQNVVIELQYSGQINPSTVTSANVYLYGPSGLVASTPTLDSTGTIVHLTPAAKLAAAGQYCFYSESLIGVNGISAQNLGVCFTAIAVTQTAAPMVVSVSPAAGLTGVPINSNVSVIFSGPVDPLTVTGSSVALSGGGYASLPASISFSAANQQVYLTPEAPLPVSTLMTLTVSGVEDIAGNTVATYTQQFTTGTSAATATPGILATNPSAGATGVPVNAAISLQANAEVDQTSVNTTTFEVYDTTLNQIVAGSYTLSPSGTTVYFVPATQLATGRQYSVYFNQQGMTDLAGNRISTGCTGCLNNFSFTTGFASSSTPPQVTGISPAAGQLQVPINAQIVVAFSEPVNAESLGNIVLSAGGNTVPLTKTLSSGNQLLTMTPASGLLANTAYTLTVNGVTDLSGNGMTAALNSGFTTSGVADLSLPTITSVAPASGTKGVPTNAEIRIGFSKGIDPVSLAGGNLIVYPLSIGSNYPVPGTLSISSDGRTVTFTPTSSLLAETQYGIYVSGVVDLEGQSLSGASSFSFTTGASSETTGPTVISVTPPNAATGVPVNAAIAVALNEAVSAVSVGSSSLTLTAGTQSVAGSVSLTNPTTLSFTPSAALSPSTTYTLSAGGFTDLAGNPASSFSSTFTTSSSATAVSSGPSVQSVTPTNGATSVPVGSAITLTYSAAIDPLSANSSTLGVFVNSILLAGSVTVSGATVTFTPASPLPGGATVHVTANYSGYLQDLAGNNANGYSFTFTTAATADTTVPSVVAVSPANNQTGVGLNGQIIVTFSKSMNPSSLTTSTIALLAADAKQSFGISISPDNRTLTLTSLNLPGSSVLTLAISSGATDLSGNALPNFTSQFTTAPAFDTSHASVVSQRPANGATGVLSSTSAISVFVNKPLNASTINGNTFQVTQNGQLVAGTLSVLGNGQSIEFAPSTPWTYGSFVQVFLDATALDSIGNTVNAYTGSFTVIGAPAQTAPTVVSLSPASNATAVPLNAVVDIVVSSALSPATVIPANVYLSGPSGTVATTLTLDSTGTVVHLAPKASLLASTQYCFYLYNVQGTNGLPLGSRGYCFVAGTAAQTSAPTVLSVSPANNLTNTPLNAQIAVLFSAPVDPVSVTSATLSLMANSVALPASISFANNNARILLSPQAPLPANTVVQLTLSGITDVAGNVVASQTTQFTTGSAADTASTGFIATNPTNSATGVPVNVAISLRANAQIDLSTANTSTFQVYDDTLGQTLAGSYTLSADAMTVFFTPASALSTGRQYSVYFSNQGMTDVAGDVLGNCSGCLGNFSFTTGFTSSSTPPQVTGISPAAGQTQVPLNAQLVISFNEPISTESLGQISLVRNGSAVALGFSLSSGNQLLTITPTAGLLPASSYTLTVQGVSDVSGNTMSAPAVATFTTGSTADLTALTITSVDPGNGVTSVPVNAQIRVGFSKGVDAVSFAGGNFIVYPYTLGASYPIAGNLAIASDGRSVTYTSSAPLLPETHYCIYLQNIVDLEGDGLTGTTNTCFTTGASSSATGPAVVAVSPQNGASGVPVNAPIEVALSEAVSSVSVGSGAIVVTSAGQPVAGSVTVPNATTLVFTPSSLLAPSTAYAVTVGGFTDLAGNGATTFSSSFTTSSSASGVKTGPSVNSFTPLNGASNIAVNTPIVITFSAAVNPLTVNSSSIQVAAGGTQVEGTYTVSGSTVTFTPATPLPGSSSIRTYVNYSTYVQDLAGNNASTASATFTTAATLDTSAPTVLSVAPANGQTGIGQNGQIVITFSKSMNPSTLTSATIALLAQDVTQSFSTSISADNSTLTLYNLNLPASTVLTLSISGATDISGNVLANFTSQFTTAAAFDTSHAAVISQRPGNGATAVPTSASPVVLFLNKPLSSSSINGGSFQVTQNGQLVAGTIALVGNGQTIEFTPSSAFTNGALVQVFLDSNAVDLSGNTVTAYKGSFTIAGTAASTAPAISTESPMSGATAVPLNAGIDIAYTQPIKASTVNTTNVTFNGPSGAVSITPTLDSTGTVVHIAPPAALKPSSSYCYYAYNLQGTNGLAAANLGACFTTGTASQTTAPTVVTVSPQDQLSNVPVNANISVLFSGTIDPISVTPSTIAVSGGGSSVIPASISFSGGNTKVLITPQAPLPAGTVMTLTVAGVTDVAGNVVPTHTTHFTTGSTAATSAAGVLVENPTNGETGVPLNAALSLQANVAFDGTTLSTSTFQVYDQTLGQTLGGTYSLSSDGMTAYFTPATPLAAGRSYTVYFSNYGMTDVAGNAIGGCSGCLGNFSFTTGFASSASAPQVTAVSPAGSAQQVPLNAQIVVAFNEAVNPETLKAITLTAGGNSVALSESLGSGNQILTMTPVAGLLPSTTYTLTINGVADTAGHAMSSAVTSTFTTGTAPDLASFSVTAVDPASALSGVPLNAQVRAAFSKPVDPITLTSSVVQLAPYYASNLLVPGSLTVSADARSITLTPSALLLSETYYCFYISGVLDLEGVSVGARNTCFYTGTATQTSAPTVTGVSPANSSSGVPVNAVVALSVSVPVSVVSLGSGTVTVSSGGHPVAGVLSAPSASVVQFTPSSALATSTQYTVSASGFTDLAGNAVSSFSSTFTTSSSSTSIHTGPTVSSVTPVNGATLIPVSTPVVLNFSAAVDPLTVNIATISVSANSENVAGSFAVNGAAVTFTPLNPLPGGATIRVYVNSTAYVQDLAGNNVSTFSSTFTTATTADTVTPAVVATTPSSGQTGVGQSGQIMVMFSKSMNPSTLTTSTVTLLAAEARQSYSLSIAADNRSITLSGFDLAASTVYTLSISGATDISGNALPTFTSQFTTAPAFDTSSATVVNQRPANGATLVSAAASPVVLFLSKPLNAGTITASSLVVTQAGQPVTGTIAVVGNGQTLTFTPASAWTLGSLVQVFLTSAAQDTSGNAVTSYKGAFAVIGNPATTAPALVNYSPANGVTAIPVNVIPDVQFSSPLNPSTVIAANVSLYSYGTSSNVPSTLTLDSTGTILRLTPSAPLATNTRYQLSFSNLQGTDGLAVSNGYYTFTTGGTNQTSGPHVTTISPVDTLANVPLNANVSVIFSAPIDPISVSGATIAISGEGSTSTPASISFASNNQKVIVTPEAPLPPSTSITIAISGVMDVAGNAVTPQTTHFTTGTAAATTTPGVVVENPFASAAGVPVNAALSLQATAPLDITSASTSTYQLYDTTLSQAVAGSYTLGADGMTIFFLPGSTLATGRTYNVYFNGDGLTDLAGNLVRTGCSGCLGDYSFTTGYAASSTPPQVTGVSPVASEQAVPTNALVAIAFSEPVNGETLGGITLTTGGSPVAFRTTLSSGNQLLTLTPVAALTPGAVYTLSVNGVADLSGNAMSTAFTSSFTAGARPDLATPTITSVTPANSASGVLSTASIQVQFSKLVDQLSANAGTVKLSTNGTTFVSANYSFNATGNILTITPSAPLSTSTAYTLQLTTGILDLEGNSIASFQSSFTTGTN